MHGLFDDSKSIFLQIAHMIEDDILRGIILPEEQVPSTNEMAKLYNINPATGAKGLNILVDEEILYKKRGIGMFVAAGAKAQILKKRKSEFYDNFVTQLVNEAKRIDVSTDELTRMIERAAQEL